ncbi:MAG TPA: M20 family metallopeptidase [Ktedonobacteraceae bacterium]|nr:M20 family metallopeptidase [Ktedonobacteraceae bacterium]
MDRQSFVMGVETYAQQQLSHYMSELRTLCAIDSYTFHKPGVDTVATYMATRMRNLGMETRMIEQTRWGNDLLGVLHGTGKSNILLLGHMDTVYPPGTAAERPVRTEGNIVYGPGVSDMKGCLLAALYAIAGLQAADYADFGELRFLCVSDEEINDRHCIDIIHDAAQDCHAAFVLESGRANGDIVSARKGNVWYTLTAHGRSAHAGVEPEKGRNAIVEVAHQVLQFQSLNGWRDGITVNPGVITGGTMPNVVPDFAQTQFDLRFLHPQDLIEVEARMHEMMQHQRVPDIELTLEVRPDFKGPLVATPASIKLAEQAQRIAIMLGFSINHILTGGASDAS